MNGLPHPSWRAAVFSLTSVDVVSAAIYTGVLLAHLPRSLAADSGWLSLTSIILVLLLFALDRVEALWFPQGTAPTRIALALLAARIALMAVVVQLDASTLTWFLFLIPPLRVCLYFGSRASYAIAAVTWVGFILKHLGSDPSGLPEVQQETILFGMALVFVCTIARALRVESLSRVHTEALLAELERSHARLQAHAETIAELATTEERNRLARDIHDSLGHYLTVTNVQIAKALAFQYRDPTIAEQAMLNAKETAHEALRAVRESVGALRTTRDAFVFCAALSALVERTRTDGCEMSVHTEGSESGYTAETLTALYYVAQEGLTNVQKHAHASDVAIDVSFLEAEARLTIRDDGRGFVVAPIENINTGEDGGYGLHTMRERLARVGGRLTLSSLPGHGTTLAAFAPRTPSLQRRVASNGADNRHNEGR